MTANEKGIYKIQKRGTTCAVPFFSNDRLGIVFERPNGTKKMFVSKYGKKSIYVESQIFIRHCRSGRSKADQKRYEEYLEYLQEKVIELNK